MAVYGLETHKISHSELTTGHEVGDLLSQIDGNFKQSKADQILRLLKDQDRLTKKLETCEWDDESILKDIKEDKGGDDSDTLTDDSESESDQQTVEEKTNILRHRGWRCKTAIGFMSERRPAGLDISDNRSMDGEMADGDTRFNRPKSSYVRRRPFRRKDDISVDNMSIVNGDEFEPIPQRPTRSARPKSRLGRASVPESERSRRKIALTEVNVDIPDANVAPSREDTNTNVSLYERFASTRNPAPKMKTKGFCDDFNAQQVNAKEDAENISVDNNSVDMKDEVHELHLDLNPNPKTITHHRPTVQHQRTIAPTPIHSPTDNFHSRSATNPHHVQKTEHHVLKTEHHVLKTEDIRSRNTPSPRTDKKPSHSPVRPEINRAHTQHIRRENELSHTHLRSDSNLSQGPPHKRQEHSDIVRPKNPEAIMSRPISRPNARRRLQRRYMPQTSTPMSSMRPTSESVILARQKTEKNLLKVKQDENRPKSEKIFQTANKTMLSVSSNPAQGPQTTVTSNSGVTQATHVPAPGFRGYDPGSRLRSGNINSKNIPADLTLPRKQVNNALGGRNPLTLMKLPPLEASLAKKKEASLQLAAREDVYV